MEPARSDRLAARSESFFALAFAAAGANAIHFVSWSTNPADWTPARVIAVASLILFCVNITYGAVAKRISRATILFLAICYAEILASLIVRDGAISAAVPLLFLAPLAAAVNLGLRAGIAALVTSMLAAAFLLTPSLIPAGVGNASIAVFWSSIAVTSIAALYLAISPLSRRVIAPRSFLDGEIGNADRNAAGIQKPAAEDVRERWAFVETVLDAISDGVLAADNNGEIKYLNRAARVFYGLETALDLADAQAQIRARRPFYTIAGASIKFDDLPLSRVLKGERPAPCELTLTLADGTVRTAVTNARPLRNAEGEQFGAVVTFHDITDRSIQEEELRWQRNLLELILDTVPVRIWIKDGDDRVVKMNNNAAAFFGISREDAIGMKIPNIVSADANSNPETEYPNAEEGVACQGLISERELGDGSKKWCRLDKASLCDPRTGAELLLVAATDVTTLKSAKDKLARANAELDQFTRAVSHDLQEPLRKLIIFSEFLEKDFEASDWENARADLNAIKSSASRMRQTIRDLLNLSKLQENEMRLKPIDPRDCIEEAIANLHLAEKSAPPQYRFESLPSGIQADRTLLTQIYQNLISNALKFMPQGEAPIIEFTAQEEVDKVILGVKDNGIGIPAEHRSRVFDPLVRLHRKDEFDGTGIGLSICAKAVSRLGGRIWIEDNRPRGTHFRFTVSSFEEHRSAA